MIDSWNGMSAEVYAAHRSRLRSPALGARTADNDNAPHRPLESQPAGGGLGPCRDLGKFYEMLLAGGTIGGRRILSPEITTQMTQAQITGGGPWTFGLGVIVNASRTAEQGLGGATRRSFGLRASPRAFGHPGATGTIAFADPETRLVLASIGLSTAQLDQIYAEVV